MLGLGEVSVLYLVCLVLNATAPSYNMLAHKV